MNSKLNAQIIANYVMEHKEYDRMSKWQACVETAYLIATNPSVQESLFKNTICKQCSSEIVEKKA